MTKRPETSFWSDDTVHRVVARRVGGLLLDFSPRVVLAPRGAANEDDLWSVAAARRKLRST
jgi:hypothetical protein